MLRCRAQLLRGLDGKLQVILHRTSSYFALYVEIGQIILEERSRLIKQSS